MRSAGLPRIRTAVGATAIASSANSPAIQDTVVGRTPVTPRTAAPAVSATVTLIANSNIDATVSEAVLTPAVRSRNRAPHSQSRPERQIARR